MGVDLAVCFTRTRVTAERILETHALEAAQVGVVYLAQGAPRPQSGNKPYFALWADAPIDLHYLCRELSVDVSPICVAWKVEHGGVAGYVTYEDGRIVDDVADDGDEYLRLPSQGVEIAFGVELQLTPDSRLFFPDDLLDDEITCFRLEGTEHSVVPVPSDTLVPLLESRLDVEPILPVDTW